MGLEGLVQPFEGTVGLPALRHSSRDASSRGLLVPLHQIGERGIRLGLPAETARVDLYSRTTGQNGRDGTRDVLDCGPCPQKVPLPM
jgi:hypothetical protein